MITLASLIIKVLKKALAVKNAIVRMLAILDRRVGKRRLISMKDRIENEPDCIKNYKKLFFGFKEVK